MFGGTEQRLHSPGARRSGVYRPRVGVKTGVYRPRVGVKTGVYRGRGGVNRVRQLSVCSGTHSIKTFRDSIKTFRASMHSVNRLRQLIPSIGCVNSFRQLGCVNAFRQLGCVNSARALRDQAYGRVGLFDACGRVGPHDAGMSCAVRGGLVPLCDCASSA